MSDSLYQINESSELKILTVDPTKKCRSAMFWNFRERIHYVQCFDV